MAEKWVKMLVQGPSVPGSRVISLLEVSLDHFFLYSPPGNKASKHEINQY